MTHKNHSDRRSTNIVNNQHSTSEANSSTLLELEKSNLNEDKLQHWLRHQNSSLFGISDHQGYPQFHSSNLHMPGSGDVEPLIVTLALVVDNAAFRKFDQDIHQVYQYCRQLVNYMNFHFSKLYLKVVLVDLIIWNERDSFSIGSDSVKTMNDFTNYNRDVLLRKSSHTHAQLITGKDQFDEHNNFNLGRAHLNTICTDMSISVVMLHNISNVELQAVINTHELAHSLNIKHTGENCSGCIMAPSVGKNASLMADKWTVGNIQDFTTIIEEKYCLFIEQPKTYNLNTCGNGLREQGEDCDIGQRDKNNSHGCDAWTCQFTSNSGPIYLQSDRTLGNVTDYKLFVCVLVMVATIIPVMIIINQYHVMQRRKTLIAVPSGETVPLANSLRIIIEAGAT